MKKFNYINMLIAAAIVLASSCSGERKSDAEQSAMIDTPELVVEVDTLTLHPGSFKIDVISNGKVKALESADLFFRSTELIDDVMVHNGQRVKKGQALARLDMFKFNSEKSKQEAAVSQALLELQDVLIGQGYNPDDIASVPADVMKLARVRSGLEQAEAAYNTVLNDIKLATLTAPFDGVVANVKGTQHSMASTADPFCRIINDSEMVVEFPVLESELTMLNVGAPVEIVPYTGGEYVGHISEINPIIDENGHVTIKATLNNCRGLMDGMNVRIRSSQLLANRLVVPKTAVVLRTGRQVVFTYKDGMAMWNYVTTGLENLDSYEITEGLWDDAVVIYDGNENLAHETPVSPHI